MLLMILIGNNSNDIGGVVADVVPETLKSCSCDLGEVNWAGHAFVQVPSTPRE